MTVTLDETPIGYDSTYRDVCGVGLVRDVKYSSTNLFRSSNLKFFSIRSGKSPILAHTPYISHGNFR